MINLNKSQHKPLIKITLIPLINVIFLLVLFFVISGRQGTTAADWVELPKASTGRPGISENITLTVTKDGILYVDKDLTPVQEVGKAARKKMKGNLKTPIQIIADSRLSASYILNILHELRKVGSGNVTLATEPE